MLYELITRPEHICAHEILMIEADIQNIPTHALSTLVPTGQSNNNLLSYLSAGRYLLLSDQPSVPLFFKNTEGEPPWRLNPIADASLVSCLRHIPYATQSEKKYPYKHATGQISGTHAGSVPPVYYEAAPLTLSQRLNKQRQGMDAGQQKNQIQARFYYRSNQGKRQQYGIWSGQRESIAGIPWRLTQDEVEIAVGETGDTGSLCVQELQSLSPCLLEYGLPSSDRSDGYSKQRHVKVNDYAHIELDSLVLTHHYDDTERTPVQETPFRITLNNGDTYDGITDKEGATVIGPLPTKVKELEFYPDDAEADIHSALYDLNQQLDIRITDYAETLAKEVKEQYQPSHTGEINNETSYETTSDQVKADFEQAVEERINELKQQAVEYDAQAWYEKAWDITIASGEGVADGFANYLPDLGALGELLDDMKLDVDPMTVIKAITLGDVDELERTFQKWKQRNQAGYEQASSQMEILLILLKDAHVRKTLLSLPQRFLDVAPTDALVKLGVAQGSQMTVDGAAIVGVTALGTAISGPGGIVAGGLATTGTLARKASAIAEQVLDTLMSLSEQLVKKRNKRKETVRGHAHDSETPNKSKEPKKEPRHCQWQTCSVKHEKAPKYLNKGRTTRSSNFRTTWQHANLEPWLLRGKGDALPDLFQDQNHKAWGLGYRNDIASDAAKVLIAASAASPDAGDEYPVEGHHLIPVTVFSKTPRLKRNIELIGWNVNDPKNGIFLPVLAPDILRHNLQLHRGGHPKEYKLAVEERLERIENDCLQYCKYGDQKFLIEDLNILSSDIKEEIEAWSDEYLIHTPNRETKEKLEQMLTGEKE